MSMDPAGLDPALLQRLRRAGPTETERKALDQLAGEIAQAGGMLHAGSYVLRDEAANGVRVAVQTAGELTHAAIALHQDGYFYPGTALVRQLLELQYLLADFARDGRRAAIWLNSSRNEREKHFRPGSLRDAAGFRRDDYRWPAILVGTRHPSPEHSSVAVSMTSPSL